MLVLPFYNAFLINVVLTGNLAAASLKASLATSSDTPAISYKTVPGGGTTDYAVDIFFKAKADGKYNCFLSEDRALPMMYMPDAIKATIGIMEAPADEVKIRTSYNLASLSFTPKELAAAIKRHVSDFEISYEPDFRDRIASNWPQSIDDNEAQKDWGWEPDFNLEDMVADMLKNIPVTEKFQA